MKKPTLLALACVAVVHVAATPVSIPDALAQTQTATPPLRAADSAGEVTPQAGDTGGTGNGSLADTPAISNHSGSQRQPLAIVRRFNPLVLVRHLSDDDWSDARRTHSLHDADTLQTGDAGFAVVQFMDNSVARVRPNSLLIVNGESRAPGNTAARIAVELGEMFLSVQGTNSTYEVATPSAVAAVRGTRFSTQVTPTGESVFTGYGGQLQITALASGRSVPLTRGSRAAVDAAGEEINLVSVPEDELEAEYADYEEMDDQLDIQTLRLRFINPQGQTEEIELEYYEVQPDEEE